MSHSWHTVNTSCAMHATTRDWQRSGIFITACKLRCHQRLTEQAPRGKCLTHRTLTPSQLTLRTIFAFLVCPTLPLPGHFTDDTQCSISLTALQVTQLSFPQQVRDGRPECSKLWCKAYFGAVLILAHTMMAAVDRKFSHLHISRPRLTGKKLPKIFQLVRENIQWFDFTDYNI